MKLDYQDGVIVLDLREGSENEGPLPGIPDAGTTHLPFDEPHALLIKFGSRMKAQKKAFSTQLYAWYKWSQDHGFRFACSGPPRLLSWVSDNGFNGLFPVFDSADTALQYLAVKLPKGWPDPAAPASVQSRCC